jgi:hypothetical protein
VQEVASSNLVVPTKKSLGFQGSFLILVSSPT